MIPGLNYCVLCTVPALRWGVDSRAGAGRPQEVGSMQAGGSKEAGPRNTLPVAVGTLLEAVGSLLVAVGSRLAALRA